MENDIICKYCQSENVIKYGKYKDTQIYSCKACGRKFKGDDTTFHMKTPANEVIYALNAYYESMPIETIQRHLLQKYTHAPSTATIYRWIQKYTQYATDSISGYAPKKIGDVWVADETVIEKSGRNVWLWDIIDYDSRFLLASLISRRRTTQDIQKLYDQAVFIAGKQPIKVITDRLTLYLDTRSGKNTKHIQSNPLTVEDKTHIIQQFHAVLKQRTMIILGLKSINSALKFMEGWLAYYNYFKPNHILGDKTPAEVAGVVYPYKSWSDIIHKYKPSRRIVIEHQPRARVELPRKQGRSRKHAT